MGPGGLVSLTSNITKTLQGETWAMFRLEPLTAPVVNSRKAGFFFASAKYIRIYPENHVCMHARIVVSSAIS